MFNRLKEIIKQVDGNVLIVGLDNELINEFNKNNKVNLLSITSNTKKTFYNKQSKKCKTNKGFCINIKKLRMSIKKKSVNYLFCNMNEMIHYYKYFIKDSIYINNGFLYLYFDKKIDIMFIINRYKRYNVELNFTEYKNGYIIEIDNCNSNNNNFKDKFFFIKDTIYNICEIIGNILIS